LKAAPLKDAFEWLERYRENWEDNFDRLEAYLRKLQSDADR
jgi:hypothetical protein